MCIRDRPNRVPVEDIIANVKAGIRGLPKQYVDVCLETTVTLRMSVTPKCNMEPAELKDLRNLRADDTIIILQADKGSTTVVMETQDYHSNIEEPLDPNTYKHLNRDPTATVLRKTDALIKQSSKCLMRRLLSGFLRHYHLVSVDCQKDTNQTFP